MSVEATPNLIPLDKCITDEQRIVRIMQEIFIKENKARTVIRCMLIDAWFTEEEVTDEIVLSYNPLNLQHLDILQRKCISKANTIFLERWFKDNYAQLVKIRTAILQLTKSSMIIARNIWIRKHAWKIIFILSGLGAALALASDHFEEKTPENYTTWAFSEQSSWE